MTRNVDCPFCGASTPVRDGEPGTCKFCNGRLDPEALGEPHAGWSGRLAAIARKSVVPLVFAVPMVLVGVALVAPQIGEDGLSEYMCSCASKTAHPWPCSALCPDWHVEPPLPPYPDPEPPIRPDPPVHVVPDVPPTQCRSPECEQWCAQFPAAELSACAHAFRAGCTVDPSTPQSECGRYRHPPR